jgi:hypothetical protein
MSADKARKTEAKLERRLEELGWDDPVLFERWADARDRVFEAQGELDMLRQMRLQLMDEVATRRHAADKDHETAKQAVTHARARLDRLEQEFYKLYRLG